MKFTLAATYTAAAGILAAVVVLLFIKHERDARRDGKIEMLTRQVARDSVVVDSLTRVSEKAVAKVAAHLDTFAKLDTAWARHRDTIPKTVERIVHDTTADSTKIRELVALVDETTRKADSTIKAAEAVSLSVRFDLMAAFSKERAAWSVEREHRAEEIALLKKQSRHWGLCAMTGYGATRLQDHTVRAGLQAGAGLCYRY